MREGLRARELSNEEGNGLLRTMRRSSGSVVTWRRAQMVLLSAQGMDVGQIYLQPGHARWFLVAEGVVEDISHEGLRKVLNEEGVSFQAIKTFKQSSDPDYEAKKNPVLELYDIADGKAEPKEADPGVVICMDEFGPLNLVPRPGKQWAPGAGLRRQGAKRRRRRATYKRTECVRHLFAALDLNRDKLCGQVKNASTARISSRSASTCGPFTPAPSASP